MIAEMSGGSGRSGRAPARTQTVAASLTSNSSAAVNRSGSPGDPLRQQPGQPVWPKRDTTPAQGHSRADRADCVHHQKRVTERSRPGVAGASSHQILDLRCQAGIAQDPAEAIASPIHWQETAWPFFDQGAARKRACARRKPRYRSASTVLAASRGTRGRPAPAQARRVEQLERAMADDPGRPRAYCAAGRQRTRTRGARGSARRSSPVRFSSG